jgi:dipeptidyl aminopeptidase/acylaminoacyl peptidase
MKTLTAMIGLVALEAATALGEQTTYHTPPNNVVRIVDASPPPFHLISPSADAVLLVESEAMPPISVVARPFYRLAGIRVDARSGHRRRTGRIVGLSVIHFDHPKPLKIEMPEGSTFGIPVWSPTGMKFAFERYNGDHIELWIADAQTAKAHEVVGVRLNDVLNAPLRWMPDGVSLLVQLVPENRGPAPQVPSVPAGPVVEQTSGKTAKLPTFQDLLKNPEDERLFGYYALSQLGIVDTRTGELRRIGRPDLYLEANPSPNGDYLLVTRLKEPFSYRVPCYWFARTTEVWDLQGKIVRTLADLPVSDDVPPQGVETGPRDIQWQPLVPARVLWVQALDGGDPIRKVPHRDAIWDMEIGRGDPPTEVVRIQHRFTGFEWLSAAHQVLITEYDRDRRWTVTAQLDLSHPAESRKVLFDRSAQDDYHDPGDPLTRMRPDGQVVVLRDGDSIYLNGRGASPAGPRPFLDRVNLETKATERLFQSGETNLESVLGFVGEARDKVVIRHESPAEPPNLFIEDLKTGQRTQLTDYRDPAPELTRVERRLLKYKRADGVPLSGMLYLPPGYQLGTRLPTVIWAYPLEYSDPSTAGQVRGSPNAFALFRSTSPLLFLTQGYAVLMNATMPVVGDPETMNETYVEQVTGAARAAVDTLVEMGIADRDRILVAGHSYGAFMTANLLAHTDLFAAGIARSGAYNRTLTPFGFQAERRSLWEAPKVYAQISPFMHADKIKAPLLLIHGEADNNSGTFPMQSERLFQAIQGFGGTARLILLPFESHGYEARESVLDVLVEMFDWADRYVKNRPSSMGKGSSPRTKVE